MLKIQPGIESKRKCLKYDRALKSKEKVRNAAEPQKVCLRIADRKADLIYM